MRECQKVFLRPIDIRFKVVKYLYFTGVAEAERFPRTAGARLMQLLSLDDTLLLPYLISSCMLYSKESPSHGIIT